MYEPSKTVVDPTKYEKITYEVKRLETLKKLLPSGDGSKALDLGSGPGVITKLIAERGWIVTAVDTEHENLQRAKSWAERVHLGDAQSILNLYPPASFEFVVAAELIEHMPLEEGKKLLANIGRVLKPGGRLLLSTPNLYSLPGLKGHYWEEKVLRKGPWRAWDPTHIYIYSAPEIVRTLREQGFEIETVVGYWYGVNGYLRLPLYAIAMFPLNYLGFNTIVMCKRLPATNG